MKTMMLRSLLAALSALLLLGSGCAFAQNEGGEEEYVNVPEGYDLVDSVYLRKAPMLDSAFFGHNIFNDMPSRAKGDAAEVTVRQSQQIRAAFHATMNSNPNRKLQGYRIRIFFDNSQTARAESEKTAVAFKKAWPGVGVYRTYESPFFKVTVGDFRSRSEALAFLQKLRGSYPSAFVLKGTIEFPPVNPERPFVTDTVSVLKRIDL